MTFSRLHRFLMLVNISAVVGISLAARAGGLAAETAGTSFWHLF